MKPVGITAATLAACVLGAILPSTAAANDGKIIVDGKGIAGKEITIVITYGGNTGADTVKFTPTAADVTDETTKAKAVAKAIREQAANSTAPEPPSGSKTATVSSKGGATIAGIKIKAGESQEKDRVNPSSLAITGLPSLQFDLALTGASTGSFLATVNIGGPGGGVFIFDTQGLSPSVILANLENSIDPLFPSFVDGDSLIITNVSADNSFLAFFDDPGFQVTHGMSAVPEPSASLLMLLGGAALLGWKVRRVAS